MKWFTYKGIRVRKFHQQVKVITFLIMLLPFLIMNGFYYWYFYEVLIKEPVKYGLIGMMILIIPIIFVLLVQIKLYRDTVFFGRLDNLRVLSTFLIQNGYYLTKKRENRESIKLPKVYIKRDQYGLDATFILQGNKFQDKFLNVAKDLEVMFDGDFMAKSFVKGYVTYTIILGSIKGRIDIRQVEVGKQGLRLMEDVYWQYDEHPHLLVSGGTGGGKTIVLMSLIYGLVKVGFVDICDPKQSDFVGLRDVPVFHGRVFWEKDEMLQCLKDNVEFMNARYKAMTNHPEYSAGKRYSSYGMKPKFIVFDEWAAFMASLDSDYRAMQEVTDYLTQIILKGRQAGVFMILALQRPDGEFIKTALRDNFMKRLSVGHLEDTGYMMMYGDANRNKEFKKIDKINGKKVYGRGYIANGGEIAREFFSPYVPLEEGFSFLEEYQKIPVLSYDGKEFAVFGSDQKTDNGELSIEEETMEIYDQVITDVEENEFEGISLSEYCKKNDKNFNKYYKLVKMCESEGYQTYQIIDGKYYVSDDDIMVLDKLFEKKEESDTTWKVVLKQYFT